HSPLDEAAAQVGGYRRTVRLTSGWLPSRCRPVSSPHRGDHAEGTGEDGPLPSLPFAAGRPPAARQRRVDGNRLLPLRLVRPHLDGPEGERRQTARRLNEPGTSRETESPARHWVGSNRSTSPAAASRSRASSRPGSARPVWTATASATAAS